MVERATLKPVNWLNKPTVLWLFCMGNTMLLATVCAAQDAVPGTDYALLQNTKKNTALPDVSGGFTRREGRAGDYEILVSRPLTVHCVPCSPMIFMLKFM